MRKMKIYTITAAALALSGLMPLTAFAGQASWRFPGGQAIVVTGNNWSDLKEALGQLGVNGNLQNCLPNLPGQPQLPDQKPQLPEQKPDQNLPGPELPEQKPELPDQTPDQGGDESQDSFAAQVAALVNEERAKAGLNPLTVDARVSQAAAVRAGEIRSSFSHTRPDGSSFSTALTQAGVSFRSSGENIAYGQRTPQEVMKGWMNSSGHRANILNPEFTSIGVGYQVIGGTPYWVQLFVR